MAKKKIETFKKDILELKEPIFYIKTYLKDNKKDFIEIKLYLDGDCKGTLNGDKSKVPRTFLINNYYWFINMLKSSPTRVLSPSGNLSSFFASYISNKGKK